MVVKCFAIARRGSRCNAPALRDSTFCWLHDPNAAGARRAASVKGGKARSNQERARKLLPPTLTADELGGHMSKLLIDVIEGRVATKIGTAAATITRALLEVRTTSDLEQRIAELEQRAGIGPDRRSA